MDRVAVALGERGYDVCVGRGLLARAGALLAERVAPSRAGIVTDEGVPAAHVARVEASLAAAGFAPALVRVPAGEGSKSLTAAAGVCDALATAGLDRASPVVAVGGGMVTDLAGLCAALLFRGVPWAAVPTTLLGQLDAAIGGKTAADLPSGKNLAGVFWQPRVVVADVEALATLPGRDLRSGLAEAVKCGFVADPPLLARLAASADRLLAADADALEEVVLRCARVKATLVARDERETGGERRLLNLGHTVGHALEAASGWSLRHGEAVALGLVAAARISAGLGLCGPEVEGALRDLLARLGLPADLDGAVATLPLTALRADKKRAGGRIQFVAIEAPGRLRAVPLEAGAIEQFLRPRAGP